MKCCWWLGCCAAIVLSSASLWGQEEEVKVRVRAIAVPDGKVEVIEETAAGEPKEKREVRSLRLVKEVEEKKERQEAEKGELRATTILRYLNLAQGAAEKVDKPAESEAVELPQSDYWIGVQIGDVPPEVRKHMAVKHGILVLHVYPDSPAAKAELQADDVLIQAGETKIETAPDLIKAVDAAKTNELKFTLLREGAEKSLTVTPMKRPAEEVRETVVKQYYPARLQEAEKQLQQALAKLQEANTERAAVDFMLVRPGAYVHGEALPKMPDDVSISITKEGSKPAKVIVKKGDKTFEATEGKLNEIPKDLRPHVERMLTGAPSLMTVQPLPGSPYAQRFEMKVAPPVAGGKVASRVVAPVPVPPVPPVPGAPGAPAYPPAPPAPPAPVSPRVAWLNRSAVVESTDSKLDQILKKLDALGGDDLEDMKKELKALRKEVDALQKKASGSESSR